MVIHLFFLMEVDRYAICEPYLNSLFESIISYIYWSYLLWSIEFIEKKIPEYQNR